MDGASNAWRASVDIIIINLDRKNLRYALRFEFKASNKKTKYEALIVVLELACKLEVENYV